MWSKKARLALHARRLDVHTARLAAHTRARLALQAEVRALRHGFLLALAAVAAWIICAYNCRLARQMAIFGPDNRKAAQQQGSLL